MSKAKIDTGRWYTLSELVRADAFPWCDRDVRAYRKHVTADEKKGNVLKGMIAGVGRGKRYKFKGSNIISFIAAVESGKVRL